MGINKCFLIVSLFILLRNVHCQFKLNVVNQIKPKEDEHEMSMLERGKFHNYKIFKYQVTTEDGYILTLFRILGKID